MRKGWHFYVISRLFVVLLSTADGREYAYSDID